MIAGDPERSSPISMRRLAALSVHKLKSFVKRTRAYDAFDRRFGRYASGTIAGCIHEYSRTRRNLFFIQVGANDGSTMDPYHQFIRRDGWQGIVIEPQPDVFEQRLKATYDGIKGITLMNVAVDIVEGTRPLYRYAFTSSRWASGMASFDQARLIDNFNTPYVQDQIRREGLRVSSDPLEYLIADAVPCKTFNAILDQAARDTIDFLITDVEGHDIQILETFPFDRLLPRHIVFELPVRNETKVRDFTDRLNTLGYSVMREKNDAIALRAPRT